MITAYVSLNLFHISSSISGSIWWMCLIKGYRGPYYESSIAGLISLNDIVFKRSYGDIPKGVFIYSKNT